MVKRYWRDDTPKTDKQYNCDWYLWPSSVESSALSKKCNSGYCYKNGGIQHFKMSSLRTRAASSFIATVNTVKVWTRKKKKKKKIPKFWWCEGALSTLGFYFTFVQGNINSEKYCSIIEDFVPYANAVFPQGWVLQQDGARAHTSQYTRNWFPQNWCIAMATEFPGPVTGGECVPDLENAVE